MEKLYDPNVQSVKFLIPSYCSQMDQNYSFICFKFLPAKSPHLMLRSPDVISPSVSSQRQVPSIYFDPSSAFYLVSHIILLHRFCVHVLSDGYAHWFRSYLSNQQSSVCILVTFSLPFEVFSGVPQRCFRNLVFNIFINDHCNVIKHSKYLLFADDIKIFLLMITFCCKLILNVYKACVLLPSLN
jgi:hypothetical protein